MIRMTFSLEEIACLREERFVHPHPRVQLKMEDHRKSLEAYFLEHPPAMLKEAATKIEEITGIRRSIPQVRKFLMSMGLRRLKVGTIPAKANIEQQEEFKKKIWNHAWKKRGKVNEFSTL